MTVDVSTVAVIGLGRMGSAMAARFADAGHRLILWNRDEPKAESVAERTGSMIARTPAEAASQSDVVVTSLADDVALLAVYLGTQGVVAGLRPKQIAIDTSTVDPESIRRVGATIDTVDARFVDCPVSGSVSTVESGQLTIMAGGDSQDVDSIEPLLSAIAKRVIRVGGRGAGSACKLAVNHLVHGLNVALSEALVLAEKAGVDRRVAYEVFASGAGGAPFVQYKRAAFEDPETATVAFSLDLVAKDYDLIIELGNRVGAPLDQGRASAEIVRQAIARGMGNRDLSALAVHLRES